MVFSLGSEHSEEAVQTLHFNSMSAPSGYESTRNSNHIYSRQILTNRGVSFFQIFVSQEMSNHCQIKFNFPLSADKIRPGTKCPTSMVSAPVVLPEAYKDSTGCKNTAIRGVSKVSNLNSEAVSINRSSCSIQVCSFTSLRSAGQFRHIQATCLFSNLE